MFSKFKVDFDHPRSTVREYVKRHDGRVERRSGGSASHGKDRSQVPYSDDSRADSRGEGRPAQKTGSQILVLLLRLRQCCSHLSLMKDVSTLLVILLCQAIFSPFVLI